MPRWAKREQIFMSNSRHNSCAIRTCIISPRGQSFAFSRVSAGKCHFAFSSPTRDVVGHLSPRCSVAFHNLNWGAYFELILSTISTRLCSYFLLRFSFFLFKMFESRYSSFSDAFSLFFYFNFNCTHLLFLHFWSLHSRRTFRRFK